MGDTRIVSAETEIRQALSTKGKRYGELDAPHLIVVLLAETVHVRQSRFERQGADCKLVVEEERIDREVRRFHTMSVAGLWRDQGKREARDLLAPVYGWFTEGFDTLDLRFRRASQIESDIQRVEFMKVTVPADRRTRAAISRLF